jgi:hypothetical protein
MNLFTCTVQWSLRSKFYFLQFKQLLHCWNNRCGSVIMFKKNHQPKLMICIAEPMFKIWTLSHVATTAIRTWAGMKPNTCTIWFKGLTNHHPRHKVWFYWCHKVVHALWSNYIRAWLLWPKVDVILLVIYTDQLQLRKVGCTATHSFLQCRKASPLDKGFH